MLQSDCEPYRELCFSDKDCFKLRANVEKCVVISLCQVSDNLTSLKVDRCFGMLVSPGRNVRHSDMQVLELVLCTVHVYSDLHAAPRECQDGSDWGSVGHPGLLGPAGGRLRCPQPGNITGFV